MLKEDENLRILFSHYFRQQQANIQSYNYSYSSS